MIKGSDTARSLEKSIESMVWGIAGTTISLLGIMIAVMALMKSFRMGTGVIILFMALIFLTLLAVDGILFWQLLRLQSRARETVGALRPERFETKELDMQREQQLLEPQRSVTDDATRIFEQRHTEPGTK